MGLGHSPSIVTSGLVMCLDAANYKSFKGTPATNILNQVGYNQSNTNTALYKYTQGAENVNIPSLGYVNSKFVDFYNDYNGGSGNCCPALFTYGTGLAVSPSTTYTYSIIYKTTTGYSHPNYMYRYEYNSGGGYVGEAGVHDTNNRTSLGDGWWFAWGQFTTSATTVSLNTYLFHYEYATQNKVYVYKAALYSGTYVIRPEHMLNSSESRGSTVATGGGWADLIGNGNHGTLTNNPTYSSVNVGSIVFDGTDDYISCGTFFNYAYFTISLWVYPGSTQVQYADIFDNNHTGTQNFVCQQNSTNTNEYSFGCLNATNFSGTSLFTLTANTWHYLTFTWNNSVASAYINGAFHSSGSAANPINYVNPNLSIARWSYLGGRHWNGRISNFNVYNKVLTSAEIQQNFNALRGRYGV